MARSVNLRPLGFDDCLAVRGLHLSVAAIEGSGLARAPDEITTDYVDAIVRRGLAGGVIIGAFDGGKLIGEIHAARLGPRQFAHVLTDLTVAVHHDAQGRGVGTMLFQALFAAARTLGATRIELVARSGNQAAIALYERLGFRREGCFTGRVRLHDGRVEDDIPMALTL
ncbi:MAG TPA: GNAT family N-acetyltransferase [Sphingomonas sp.]|nr:GNAT family N-acetyltransferase [Sphingomonas sp.]